MDRRIKKKNTTLFFDSFKHFKNNFCNLVCLELPMLIKVGVQGYFKIKYENYNLHKLELSGSLFYGNYELRKV